MKALSSAAFLVAGLALGILLGKGPLSPDPVSGSAAEADGKAARSAKSGRSGETRSLHPGVSTIRQADPSELAALVEQATTMTDPVEIRRLLSECLLHMTSENWKDVIATFGNISKTTGRDPAEEWKLALFRSGQIAGAEAMDHYVAAGLKDHGSQCWNTLYGWASKDPRDALAWLAKAEAEGQPITADHYTALLAGAALSNPQDAVKLLEELPADKRKDCAGHFVWNVVQNGGIQALDPILEFASGLDTSVPGNGELAGDLLHEVTEKLLWKADHARDVQEACEVVAKLAQYGRDANQLTRAALQKYRWYVMPQKLDILETVSAGPKGSELRLDYLTTVVMSTMNGEQDRAAVQDWMQQHPDSALIPHLQKATQSQQ